MVGCFSFVFFPFFLSFSFFFFNSKFPSSTESKKIVVNSRFEHSRFVIRFCFRNEQNSRRNYPRLQGKFQVGSLVFDNNSRGKKYISSQDQDADEVSLKMMPCGYRTSTRYCESSINVLSKFATAHRLRFRDVISKQRNDTSITHATAILPG